MRSSTHHTTEGELNLHTRKKNSRNAYAVKKRTHTKSNCFRPVKCSKCAGDHLSSKCRGKDPSKFKCPNCGKNHSANYCGFVAHQRTLKSIGKPKVTAVQRTQQKQPEQVSQEIPGRSYREVAAKTNCRPY